MLKPSSEQAAPLTQPRSSAIVALLALAGIWGYNWVQMKIAVHYAPPFQFAALRICLGSVSLLLALLCMSKPHSAGLLARLAPKEIRGTMWVGLLQIAGMYGLTTWALVSGGAGKTSVLVYTMPLWTIVFAWMFLKERVRGWQWVAIGLSITGIVLILEPQHLGGSLPSKLLAILAGISWAGGAIVAKKVRQAVDLDLLSFTTWQMVAGAIPLTIIALLVPSQPIIWSGPFIVALIYTVIPGTAIATLLWLFVLHRLPAGMAGLGLLLNPVVGVLSAWLQLGEQPSGLEAGGMLIVTIALAINAMQALKAA